ncbi:MAG: SpoIIE family protein phosphatase [Candidatus Omnitrophica bacterium]|nr:SpoIIE family protein phosphatase [Candidatus Omnitrophota bacterium]
MTNRIPAKYLEEFLDKQSSLIKSRVALFCILTIGLYSLVSILGLLMQPETIKPQELPLWAFLVIGAVMILVLNKRAKRIGAAKLNAYLFCAFLLFILTKVNVLYYEYATYASSIYLFTLFLVAFTIPWLPTEVIAVTIMHLLAYTSYYFYIQRYMPEAAGANFGIQSYIDGVTFLALAFILCIVVRRKETARDIENFVLYKEVEEKNAQTERELELATRVHRTLIPKSVSSDLVDIAVMYLPVYCIGGDYAKFHFIGKDKLIFIICDVTGHGVSAALLVNRFHTEFERSAREGKEPGDLLEELNDFIVKDFEGTNMFLSAFCGLLDFKKKELLYSNHGHPAQYIYQVRRSDIQCMDSQAGLLGIFPEEKQSYQKRVDFEKGDKILLFTDGVTETMDDKQQLYGKERLEAFIRKNHKMQVELFSQTLLDELNSFKGGDFNDDIFMLNIAIK